MKHKICLTRLSVSSPCVQSAERVLVLADLHEQIGTELLPLLLEHEPTLALIPGDCLEENSPSEERRRDTLALVRALAVQMPVYCSLGNHEMGVRGNRRPLGTADSAVDLPHHTRELCRILTDCGATVLHDRYVRHGSLCIGGLTSAGDRAVTTGFLSSMANEAGYRLLMCHHPEYYERYVRQYGLDLTVSGHAHGGQWRIFGRGVYAPGQGLFPRYTSGFYDEGHLLVSRGLAGRFRIPRLANSRQALLIDLNSSK